jgi:hypothetical protein
MKKIYFIAALCALFTLQASAQCGSFVASSQATGSTTSVTISAPAGLMPNDVMIAAIHCGWCNSGSAITAPAGWTLINQTSNTGSGCGSGNTSIQLATFYKVAGASEPSSYTFTGNTNQMYVGGIVAYSGINTVTPVNVNSNNGGQDACGAITASGVTTTAACTRLVNVFICSVNSSATNIIPQPSLTERVDVGTTGNHPWGNENLEISDESFSSAGATGSRTAALSGCSGTGWITAGQMIALEASTTTGINDQTLNSFVVSPNPSSGIFGISARKQAAACQLEVYDCLGKRIRTAELRNGQTSLDLSDAPKGIYFLKLVSSEENFVTKIVVQ